MINKLALSGQLRAGKNFVAEALDYPIIGFADPIYKIVEHLTGTSDKTVPGIRQMMQEIGQWGWGMVSEEYPWTVARSLVIKHVHAAHRAWTSKKESEIDCYNTDGVEHPFGSDFKYVNWLEYGTGKQQFWVDIMLSRAEEMPRVAVVNTRFEHELNPLLSAGFEHYHVMCSEATRVRRLGGEGSTLKTAMDASEMFAIKCNKIMPDERVIWNDTAPIPAGKHYMSLARFKLLEAGKLVFTPPVSAE